MLAVGGCLKTPDIFHLDTPVIWTVLYVIIHGSLFKLEFKTTNFRILVCRKDKKRMNSIWPAARLWNCGSTAPFSLPANCEAQGAATRLGFFFTSNQVSHALPTPLPSCLSAPHEPRGSDGPLSSAHMLLPPPRVAHPSSARLCDTGSELWAEKSSSVPAHLDFTSPSGTFPHPDWLLTRIETELS